MHRQTEMDSNRMNLTGFALEDREPLMVEELRAEQEAEVMDFLRERPAHTFGMAGFIRTNGLVSAHNRGSFYACRDKGGKLEGVALIGRYILFEARSDSAIEAFARLAQNCQTAHMLLGDREEVKTFWDYYAQKGQEPRLFCRELLLELSCLTEVPQVPRLRLAELDDLDLIVPAHAQLALDESGIDPLTTNPDEFRQRCARRIQQGQTWVWVEEGTLMFKADVITDTADVVYVEGVWVDPQERGKGHGLKCMSELSGELLKRTRSLCLLVNEEFEAAQGFYKRAGFRVVGNYDTIFLKQKLS